MTFKYTHDQNSFFAVAKATKSCTIILCRGNTRNRKILKTENTIRDEKNSKGNSRYKKLMKKSVNNYSKVAR